MLSVFVYADQTAAYLAFAKLIDPVGDLFEFAEVDLGIQFAARHQFDAVAQVIRGTAHGTFEGELFKDHGIGVDRGGVAGHADEHDFAVRLDGLQGIIRGLAGAGEVNDQVQVPVSEFQNVGFDFLRAELEGQFLSRRLSGGDIHFAGRRR